MRLSKERWWTTLRVGELCELTCHLHWVYTYCGCTISDHDLQLIYSCRAISLVISIRATDTLILTLTLAIALNLCTSQSCD